MFHLEILFRSKQQKVLPASFYREVFLETLRRSKIHGILEKDVSMSAASVDLEEIRSVNASSRGKDSVTDILSFHEYSSQKAIASETSGSIYLGELVFSEEFILQSAKEDAVTIEEEMAFVFSHGILHLLGFRHGERMFSIQEEISREYSPKGDYKKQK